MTIKDVATRVKLGTVQIKGLQALVWWIHDHQTYNQPLNLADFGQVEKRAVMKGKRIEKEMADTDAKVTGLGKFKVEDFDVAEDGFNNLIYQKTGKTKADLRYIIRDRVVLEFFPNVSTERM